MRVKHTVESCAASAAQFATMSGLCPKDAEAIKFTVYKVTTSDGCIYYGLTCKDIKFRGWQHRNTPGGPVYSHLAAHPSETCAIEPIASGLSAIDAARVERELIAAHSDQNTLLNRNKGGTLGRTLGSANLTMIDFKQALTAQQKVV